MAQDFQKRRISLENEAIDKFRYGEPPRKTANKIKNAPEERDEKGRKRGCYR